MQGYIISKPKKAQGTRLGWCLALATKLNTTSHNTCSYVEVVFNSLQTIGHVPKHKQYNVLLQEQSLYELSWQITYSQFCVPCSCMFILNIYLLCSSHTLASLIVSSSGQEFNPLFLPMKILQSFHKWIIIAAVFL